MNYILINIFLIQKIIEGKIIKKTDNKLINNLIKKLIKVNIEERIKQEEYFNDDFFKINKTKMKINKQFK